MNQRHSGFYRAVRGLLGLALGFYFRRIERFHIERVPATGPVLLVSNHPNSLTDSFVMGASIPRKVNFIGTVQLFAFKPVKWLLTQCGVIPINRAKDNPKAMRSVADTFEAVYCVLERGEAVGIFPEGVTYDDSSLKEVKSGAARMALELEARHGGKLGLKVAPVGLTYSAKEIYRSDALVNFGEPINAADFIDGYAERRKECIVRLTEEIERRIQSLILHMPKLEEARVVQGVKGLYFDRLLLGTRVALAPAAEQARELVLTQQIAEVVARIYRTQPARAAAFAARLDHYERCLRRLRISDTALELFPQTTKLAAQTAEWSFIAIMGAPIALYGWAHRLIPYALVKWSARKFTMPDRRKAQASTTAIAAGTVGFCVCYAIYILVFHCFFRWPATLWYALTLPAAGLLAHYYVREMGRLWASVQTTVILLRAPSAAKHLLAMRARLIREIEAVRAELERERQGSGVQ